MAENSLIIAQDEDEGFTSGSQQICSLCLTQFAKYTCPRCNVRYCSLNCYKSEKHAQCSEGFYREWFMSELQHRRGSPEEKQRMLDILKRLETESEGDDDEGGGDELIDRLAGLDLDKEIDSVWKRLTPAEQREFQKMTQTGGLGHLLSVHTPWWELSRPVVPLDKATNGDDSLPEVLTDLPPLNTLIKREDSEREEGREVCVFWKKEYGHFRFRERLSRYYGIRSVVVFRHICYSVTAKSGQVSPSVRCNVLNVLYAYAYAVRLFNGEHHDLPLQASEAILHISTCLSANTSFSKAGDALRHAMAAVQLKPNLYNSAEFSTSVLNDVSQILCHHKSRDCHVTRALSDLHRLLGTARAQLKTTKGGSKQLWLARKKVYFLIVWAKESPEEHLSILGTVVDIEHETLTRDLEEHREAERETERRLADREVKGGHKLIEELN